LSTSVSTPRVALLAIDYLPSVGGIQAYLHGVTSLWADLPMHIYAPGSPRVEDPENLHRLGFEGTDPLSRALLNVRMVWAARRSNPTVSVAGHVLVLPAALALRALGAAKVLAFAYGAELRAPHSRWLTRKLLRRVDQLVAISRFTTDELIKLGVHPHRITLLPPAIDPTTSLLPERGDDVQSSIKPPYLLCLGRLDDLHKGQDMAIRALRAVVASNPDVTLVVAGDGPMRPALERHALNLGVGDRVTFVGRVSEAQKHRLLRNAAALALLSREEGGGKVEGFGIVVLEAAIYGVPAIVGASGGLPDAVDDGQTGLVVDSLDTKAVAEGFRAILDPPTCRVLGQAAKERVLADFTWGSRRNAALDLLTLHDSKR
jgi:phosphatidyl-myo-inositol dimannoside synthase